MRARMRVHGRTGRMMCVRADPSRDGRWLKRRSQDLIFAAGNATTPVFKAGVVVLQHEEPDDYLLSHGQSALSSAWSRFTVLFGMGRGGTSSLWSSGMTGCCVAVFAPQPI